MKPPGGEPLGAAAQDMGSTLLSVLYRKKNKGSCSKGYYITTASYCQGANEKRFSFPQLLDEGVGRGKLFLEICREMARIGGGCR